MESQNFFQLIIFANIPFVVKGSKREENQQKRLLETKLMRSDIANRDLVIGDARLAADNCRLP